MSASFTPSNLSGSDATGVQGFDGVVMSVLAERIGPALAALVIYAALGAACLPLLLALFYFSAPRIRRTPLFIIVVFDVLLGIAMSCWMVTIQLLSILKPLTGLPRVALISFPLVAFLSPWVIDLVLLLRLYAVFPTATTPRRTIYAVFAFTACIKAARLGCGVANAARWVSMPVTAEVSDH